MSDEQRVVRVWCARCRRDVDADRVVMAFGPHKVECLAPRCERAHPCNARYVASLVKDKLPSAPAGGVSGKLRLP